MKWRKTRMPRVILNINIRIGGNYANEGVKLTRPTPMSRFIAAHPGQGGSTNLEISTRYIGNRGYWRPFPKVSAFSQKRTLGLFIAIFIQTALEIIFAQRVPVKKA
jgi:hypothetical protein